MGNVGNGPVVVDGVSTSCVSMVIVPAPLSLDALWGRETGVWGELLPHTTCSVRCTIIKHYTLEKRD